MPLVGDGTIPVDFKKITKELPAEKKMEECLRRILQPFNTSESLIGQKIKGIQGIRSRANYDILSELAGKYDSTYVSSEEAEAADGEIVIEG